MSAPTILVPVDGSPPSLRALEFAIDMAVVHPGTSLVLLHVWNVHALDLLGVTEAGDENWLLDAGKRGSDKALNDAVAKAERAKVPFETLIRSGHVAESIVAVAGEVDAKYIVMGTRGLGGVEGLLMGSVATQVMHLAKTPVTLIK